MRGGNERREGGGEGGTKGGDYCNYYIYFREGEMMGRGRKNGNGK